MRATAAPITYLNSSISDRAGRPSGSELLNQRIVSGYLLTWNTVNDFQQRVLKGAATKSIKDRGPQSNAKYKLTMLWQHHGDDPLGQFAKMEEDNYGLYFETAPLDPVPNADRTLMQIRSGTINQFSVGFNYVWDKMEYNEELDTLDLSELDIMEGSVVTFGADQETYAMRSKQSLEQLALQTEDFISSLPRTLQLEARQIFARHKSLINSLEPLEEFTKALKNKRNKPTAVTGINYDYLIKNL